MRWTMKRCLVIGVLLCVLGVAGTARAATVEFGAGNTLAEVQSYTVTLLVNDVPFVLTPTCTAPGGVVACSAPLPNVAAAYSPTGPQRFELVFRDTVLNVDSPRSAPFLRSRPLAPINGRLQ